MEMQQKLRSIYHVGVSLSFLYLSKNSKSHLEKAGLLKSIKYSRQNNRPFEMQTCRGGTKGEEKKEKKEEEGEEGRRERRKGRKENENATKRA